MLRRLFMLRDASGEGNASGEFLGFAKKRQEIDVTFSNEVGERSGSFKGGLHWMRIMTCFQEKQPSRLHDAWSVRSVNWAKH